MSMFPPPGVVHPATGRRLAIYERDRVRNARVALAAAGDVVARRLVAYRITGRVSGWYATLLEDHPAALALGGPL